MTTEEVCASCKYRGDCRNIVCGNPDSPEFLEEKRWNESCDYWEMESDEREKTREL